jgi:putative ABC transport system permease protein
MALLVTPAMAALLHGVAPTDPVTYIGVAVALGGVTVFAMYLPARRASLVHPVVALQSKM